MSGGATRLAGAICLAAAVTAHGRLEGETMSYRVQPASSFADGCFELCACPIAFTDGVEGTFSLSPAEQVGEFRLFDVTDVDLLVSMGSEFTRITGGGTYRIGGASGRQQELVLDLAVGDRPFERYVSGLVEATTEFPRIELKVQRHLEPACFDTEILLVASPTAGQQQPFVRGDCGGDGIVDISDAVCVLNWLFLGESVPSCLAATNANGDAVTDISDPVTVLIFLFLGGPPPLEPFPECGPPRLEVDEQLGCEASPAACRLGI